VRRGETLVLRKRGEVIGRIVTEPVEPRVWPVIGGLNLCRVLEL
jgi:hypothetical protein